MGQAQNFSQIITEKESLLGVGTGWVSLKERNAFMRQILFCPFVQGTEKLKPGTTP